MITKYKLFLESIEQTLTYNKDSKSMVGVYKVIERDDNFTTLENNQEIQEMDGRYPIFYLDNKLSGLRYKRIIKLPSSQIKLDKEIGDNYFEVTIPYSVYKENRYLEVKRLDPEKFRIKNRF